MLVSELQEIERLFCKPTYFGFYFTKPDNPYRFAGTAIYKDDSDGHGTKYCVMCGTYDDRMGYSAYLNSFNHEGSAVYSIMLGIDFRKSCSADYELLTIGQGLKYEEIYGVIIWLGGVWRVYIGDNQRMDLDKWGFKSAKEAKEYFVKQHEKDLDFWKMVEEFLYDVKVDFKIV